MEKDIKVGFLIHQASELTGTTPSSLSMQLVLAFFFMMAIQSGLLGSPAREHTHAMAHLMLEARVCILHLGSVHHWRI